MTPTSPIVVIGAGAAGLSAAYHLGADALLLEQRAAVGGGCQSYRTGGFTFDLAGHIMFSKDPYVLELYRMLLGDNVHWQDREAWIYSKGVYTRYPFQASLYGLPPKVIQECVDGVIAANRNGPLTARNYEEFIYQVWGAGIARHFMVPYGLKQWTVPLSELETAWMNGRVPLPNVEEIIAGAQQPMPPPLGPTSRFGYPLQGGFQALMEGFVPHLRGELRLNMQVAAVSPRRRALTLAGGGRVTYTHLITTIALPAFVQLLGDEAPPEVRAAAAGLRWTSLRCVNLGVGRAQLSDRHWIYFPEDTIFHRIFLQGNASPACNPPGGFGLTCEISYSPYRPLPETGPALIRRCIADCRRAGLLRDDDPLWVAEEVDVPYAYVIPDHSRRERVALIREWLAKHGILLAGRYSEWEYYDSHHAFLAGRHAAEAVRTLNA
jgi:UDP-galactopyranose mutase